MVEPGAKTEIVKQFGCPAFSLGTCQSADHLRQHHVFERGKLRQEMMGLINKADLIAPDTGALIIGQNRSRLSIDVNVAAVGMLKQPGNMEQCRLSGA